MKRNIFLLSLLIAGLTSLSVCFQLIPFNNSPTVNAQVSSNWYSTWLYRQKININRTMVANTNQVDFPVVVSITNPVFKSSSNSGHVASDDGGDFVFTAADGMTKLDHELEKYDPVTGEIIAWVRIPTLSFSTDTGIYLYYGNFNNQKQWNLAGTWKNSYKGVWHLNENGKAVVSEYKDSLGVSNGQGGGGLITNTPSQQIGKIFYSQYFNGSAYIDIPNTTNINIGTSAITLESWVKYDATPTSYQGIFSKDGYDGGYRWFIASDNRVWFQLTGKTYSLISATKLQKGLWYYLVATYDGKKMKLFINGIKDTNEKSRTGNIKVVTDRLWIGTGDNNCLGQSWCYPYKGNIDNIRISSVARSADWIKTEFNNQNNPQNYLTFSAEEQNIISPTPTLTPTPTPTPTLTPTPTPIINEWNYKILIPSVDHQNYGFAYPITYIFDLPSEVSNLTVYKKTSAGGNWSLLPIKQNTEYFNGIEAARFYYSNKKSYISVAFSNESDEIYLRFEDTQKNKVAVIYNSIAKYYDNRKSTAVFTADDWEGYYAYPEFVLAADAFQSRNMWLTVGLVTESQYLNSWQGIQNELDEGYIEPASHSRTHSSLPYFDYDGEIGGCLQDIKNNLNLPALNRNGGSEYVYAWIEPNSEINSVVSQKLGYYKYLVDRGGGDGNTSFSSWDSTNGLYNRVLLNISLDSTYVPSLNYINSYFDQVYQSGGIYLALFHPAGIDWSTNGYLLKHLDYVKGKTDVWYVGLGHLYTYHYLQDRGVLTIIPAN